MVNLDPLNARFDAGHFRMGLGPVAMFRPKSCNGLGRHKGQASVWPEKAVNLKKNSVPNLAFVTS